MLDQFKVVVDGDGWFMLYRKQQGVMLYVGRYQNKLLLEGAMR